MKHTIISPETAITYVCVLIVAVLKLSEVTADGVSSGKEENVKASVIFTITKHRLGDPGFINITCTERARLDQVTVAEILAIHPKTAEQVSCYRHRNTPSASTKWTNCETEDSGRTLKMAMKVDQGSSGVCYTMAYCFIKYYDTSEVGYKTRSAEYYYGMDLTPRVVSKEQLMLEIRDGKSLFKQPMEAPADEFAITGSTYRKPGRISVDKTQPDKLVSVECSGFSATDITYEKLHWDFVIEDAQGKLHLLGDTGILTRMSESLNLTVHSGNSSRDILQKGTFLAKCGDWKYKRYYRGAISGRMSDIMYFPGSSAFVLKHDKRILCIVQLSNYQKSSQTARIVSEFDISLESLLGYIAGGILGLVLLIIMTILSVCCFR